LPAADVLVSAIHRYAVKSFDLDNPEIYNQVKEDYNLVRNTIIERGFSVLTGIICGIIILGYLLN
jgi:hypothetical protein